VTITIDPRLEGPPGLANGGVICGTLARRVEPGDGIAVTIRRPVPVGIALEEAVEDDGAPSLRHAGEVLAVARVGAGDPPAGAIPAVDPSAARASRPDPAYIRAHPFPGCFGCGPDRDPADAVALLPGPVGDGVLATAWTPGPGLPQDLAGTLAPVALWAALDCPSAAAAVPAGATPHVLGRLHGRVRRSIAVGEEVVVIAWALGDEGRKRYAATAIVTPGGEPVATAHATWIALAPGV
jgi:hypothetical protein